MWEQKVHTSTNHVHRGHGPGYSGGANLFYPGGNTGLSCLTCSCKKVELPPPSLSSRGQTCPPGKAQSWAGMEGGPRGVVARGWI